MCIRDRSWREPLAWWSSLPSCHLRRFWCSAALCSWGCMKHKHHRRGLSRELQVLIRICVWVKIRWAIEHGHHFKYRQHFKRHRIYPSNIWGNWLVLHNWFHNFSLHKKSINKKESNRKTMSLKRSARGWYKSVFLMAVMSINRRGALFLSSWWVETWWNL